ALMKFADEEEPISKSPVVRLYRATKQSFYQRSALQFRHPENSQITLSYLSNGESQTLTYNVYVYMSEPIGNLADLCPIHPDYTLNAGKNQIQKNRLVVDTEEEQRKLAEEYQLRLDEQQIRMTRELEEWIRPQPLIPHPEIDIEQYEQKYDEFWEDEELIEDLQGKYEQKQQKDKIGDTVDEKQVHEQKQKQDEQYQQEKKIIKQIQKETQQTKPNETEYEDGVIIPHKGRLKTKTRSNEDTNYQYWNPYPASGIIQLQAYRLTSRQVGILYIGTFGPSDQDAFANYIFMYIREFTNTSSQYHCDRLILDVQGNGGGLIRCGRFALNLIFPQVGFPLYQIADTVKTELNNEMEKIDIFSTRFNYNQSEIASWVGNLTQKPNFYSIGSRTRKTVDVNDSSRWMTVNITDPYVLYMGNTDIYRNKTINWNLKRKELYSPQDVIVITDGNCASTCSQFIKHIGQKHLARIAGIGFKNPLDLNSRFDSGICTSATVFNIDSMQALKQSNPLYGINITKIPKNLYRLSSQLTWSNRGGYGYTPETQDKLLEYFIVDPDFRVESDPFVSYANDTWKRISLYFEVLQREDALLKSASPNDPKKCLSWEVDVSGAQLLGNCKGCVRDDQHAVYGHACSTRGANEMLGREIDGSAKIGIVNTSKCVFSYCKVGYYRAVVSISGDPTEQCILTPIGPNQARADVTPDQTLDAVLPDDNCEGSCKYITDTTPTDMCPCPNDPALQKVDPRKGTMCPDPCNQQQLKSYTPITVCSCSTDPIQQVNDPRKGNICPDPCQTLTQTTSITLCPCPSDPSLLINDPRQGGLCPLTCSTITAITSTTICPCKTDPAQQITDPRKGGICPDPCSSSNINSNTPLNVCPCQTDPFKQVNDPRKGGLCPDPCAIIIESTSTSLCPCSDDQSLQFIDPRKGTTCPDPCNQQELKSQTPIEICPCQTDPSQQINDPRKGGLCPNPCSSQLLNSSTPTEICPCSATNNRKKDAKIFMKV
ncbi:MAG: hypothetical protein EZS28_024346, partial [Streblomastix strix]